jgi:glycosyltransferase 2 family protein
LRFRPSRDWCGASGDVEGGLPRAVASSQVKLRIVVIAALGLCLALYLLVYVGLGAVLSAASAIGWGGFAVLCLYSLSMFLLVGAAWYVLMPASPLGELRVFVWARMVRDAAGDVLPFSALGGIALGARAAMLHRVTPVLAIASTIVDVTTELLAQVAYIAIGLAILSVRAPRTSFASSVTKVVVIGLVLAVVASVLFVLLQRHGHRMTARLAARLLPRALSSTTAINDALDAIYASRARVALSSSIHLAAWVASSVTTWIAFRLIGVRVDLASVIAIESLVCAARSAAVLIPNALGVQEASYAVLAPLFGIEPQFALAVSLLKRARDIAVGVPILLIAQGVEGRHALAGNNSDVIDPK